MTGNEWFEQQYDDDTMTMIVADYRSTFFRDAASRRVLAHLLNQMSFFREQRSQEDMYLMNLAKKVLSWCGIWNPPNIDLLINELSHIDGGYNEADGTLGT